MPVIGQSNRPDPAKPSDADIYAAEWERFEAGFKRSRKGQLWQDWEARPVGLYKRRDRWAYFIVDEVVPTYSRESFGSEEAAISALGEALGVGR